MKNIRYSKWQIFLSDWTIVKIVGKDKINFLQGQTTNDLKLLTSNNAILNTRLNRFGKIQSYFYTAKYENEFFIFIEKKLKENLINDLNSYIIMDDVEFVDNTNELWFIANDFSKEPKGISGEYAGLKGIFLFQKSESINELKKEDIETMLNLNGFPQWEKNINETMFINETILNDMAISYQKGCFLGQETVSKIENNRGAAYFPVLIRFDEKPIMGSLTIENKHFGEIFSTSFYENKYYAHAVLNRENRIIGKKICNGEVCSYPLFKKNDAISLAQELYYEALSVFNSGDTSLALKIIQESIDIIESADALEVQGVLLARLNKFEEAIASMNRLIEVDPKSIMAHTNKSLYLMKLGKIAEAEEEKSIATVLGFEKMGDEALLKKKIKEDNLKKENEINLREQMFKKVLEIDLEDNIANFGMADIKFQRGNFNESINYLQTVLKVDPKYSQGYLLMGKNYEAINEVSMAKEIYSKGILVASNQGEMMPANEMQSRLNKLLIL